MNSIVAKLLIFSMLLGLVACASPAKRLDSLAQKGGLTREVVAGEGFEHVIYFARGGVNQKRLHVYLEGDGIPWSTRYTIASDPTPRDALVLRMMALDDHDKLYVARPCYNGFAISEKCHHSLWTSKRYSSAVVDSMAAVINRYMKQHGYLEVVLIGHSGGGTLAMLLAQELDKTVAVITVAANMDIDAWTKLHDYTPLHGSLNPVLYSPLSESIWQLHLAGGKDNNVPPSLIENAVVKQKAPHFVSIGKYDHRCCWLDIWPHILTAVQQEDVDVLSSFK